MEQHGEQIALLVCPSQLYICQKSDTALRIILLKAANFAEVNLNPSLLFLTSQHYIHQMCT